jgi:electron transport complex protein RnfG
MLLKLILRLMIVYLIGGLLIAFIYGKTAPIIFVKERQEKMAEIRRMIPETNVIEVAGVWHPHYRRADYYTVKTYDDDIIYVAESYGKGYQSYIHLLVSVDKNFVIRKVNILSHAETAGCADAITSDYFLDQFKGKTIDALKIVKKKKDKGIQAISGATISSRAIAEDAVKNALRMLINKNSVHS